ncbi:hypothetical protein C5167_045443 [Papaver somniferum]|uniref:Large ribosomal subunit protein bL17c n=1 Tax=Papaver somniferum TaxID=3469 RepID=A0A4Y7LDN3_PAPSO|nr:50S ribosomal protein L17, chloroplastic-like [Papaver somniferum]RZC82658.1 hypothetical protein C5167_045443 [Papaver somniferum]
MATATASSTWNMTSLRSALPTTLPSPSPSPSLSIPSLHFPISSSYTSSSLKFSSSTQKPKMMIPTFNGLSSLNPLLSFGTQDMGFTLTIIDNGGRVYAMRHGRKVPKLNRPPDQRKALLRGLTTQLLKHGRIKTTRARASAMRKFVDKMITLAKDGSLHKRRQALGYIYEKQIVHALFAEVPERYGERNGGYTRIIRTLPRRGDNAPMAYIELV